MFTVSYVIKEVLITDNNLNEELNPVYEDIKWPHFVKSTY